jgi:DHA1 family inner membrane transport protein
VVEPPAHADRGDELPRQKERLAVASLALAAFALNLNTNVLGALLPFVQESLHLGSGDAPYLLAAAAAGSALGALGVGVASRRFGRRTVLAGGLGLFVVASLLHLLATSFWPFVVLRTVSGLAVGLAYAAASALAAELAPYGRRGAAMGMFNAGMFLAIPIGMPLSVWLARQGHWEQIFAVQAGVGALGCWWALRAVPARVSEGVHATFASVLRHRGVVAGLLATMLHVGSFFTSVQLATTWLDRSGRVAKEDQMLLWIGLGLASVAGSALLGRWSDRIGKRTFVLATSVVLVACFGALAREPGGVVLTLVGTLLALAAAARTGPLQALVSGLVPTDRFAALMGLRGFVMQAGVLGFALAAAPIGDRLGFQGVLLFAAGCQLVSYLLIRFRVDEAR